MELSRGPHRKAVSPGQFTKFGDLLHYLRRRARLTQRELSAAVGYSDSQISRLEHNQRVPDRTALTALFIPALNIVYESEWIARLLELGDEARQAEAHSFKPVFITPPPNNLPLQLTSFLGRDLEMAQILSMISSKSGEPVTAIKKVSRLTTLTGPGGVGKTRLAIQTAAYLVEDFPDGIWLVDFAPLVDPARVPQTVAAILGLREEGSQSILAILVSHLRLKTSLLLLDNCEHLIDSCANLALAVLQACPNVSILVTSRESLGIAGEIAYLVDPLPVPKINQAALSIECLIEHAGVRLFVERAQDALPSFTLTADNSLVVAEICRRVDGLPLAIELAAAQLRVLSIDQIADHLVETIQMLRRGIRNAPLRSQTLQACMDWSYNLLSDTERLLLNRLAVFVGGWTLEAAENVCTDEIIHPPEAITLLAELVEKSLVVVERRSSGLRYRFLETIYQYALEKLKRSGEISTLKDKHLDFYLSMIEMARLDWDDPDRNEKLNRIEADYDNLRAALEWSQTSSANRAISFRLLKQLGVFWNCRGFLDEGRQRLSAALASPWASELTLERAELLFQSAWLAFFQSDLQTGLPLLTESRTIFRQLYPEGMVGEADVLISLAMIEIDNGEARIGLEHAQKALEIGSKINLPRKVSAAHHMMGVALGHLSEYENARKHLESSLALDRTLGRRLNLNLFQNLGELAVRQGDYGKGKTYLEEGLRLAIEAKDKWEIGANLGTLGWVALQLEEFERARQLFRESLAVRQEIGEKGGIAWCLEKLAELAVLQGAPEKAARILGKAASLRLTIDSRVNSADKPDYDRMLGSLRERIQPEIFQSAWEAGSKMPLSEVISLALAA